MTRLLIYRTINFQFFDINFSPISIFPFIFGAKKSSATPNKNSQNQQSSPILLKRASEKTDDNPPKSSQNRLTIDENDFLDRPRFFKPVRPGSRKTATAAAFGTAGSDFQILRPHFQPPFQPQATSRFSIVNKPSKQTK